MKPRPMTVIQCLVTVLTLNIGYAVAESYDYDDYSEATTNKEDRSSSQLCYVDDYSNFGSFQRDFEKLHDDETDRRLFS